MVIFNSKSFPSKVFSKACFTLIELLVVVAIIAVLVAILLPALGKARESARRAVCASNTHQITAAANMYADDSSGWYPSISGCGNPSDPDPNKQSYSCYPWWLVGYRTRPFIIQYLPGPQVLYCPSATWNSWEGRKLLWDQFINSGNGDQFISYNLVFGSHSNVDSPWIRFVNYSGDAQHPANNPDGDGTYPVKNTRVNDPSKRVLVADVFNNNPAWIVSQGTNPHNHSDGTGSGGAGSSEGFVDGHAEWKKPGQLNFQFYITTIQEWW